MKVLVACEESQRVMSAFRSFGHLAFSCDLQDCSGGFPEYHIKGDVIPVIEHNSWDLIIAHPPCTFLCVAGACNLVDKNGESWCGVHQNAKDRSKTFKGVALAMAKQWGNL